MRREFNLLWAATGISNLGDGLQAIAMPLLATTLTTNPTLIALVAVTERVAWLAAALPGGDLADRFDRRRIRVTLDFVRGALVAALVALLLLDRLSFAVLLVIAAVLSAAESVVDSSSMAIVPATVDPDQLEQAGARLMGTEVVVGSMIGPALGGLLFGLAAAAPFGVNAVTFLLAGAIMLANKRASVNVVNSPGGTRMRERVGEGMKWLFREGEMRAMALLSTLLGAASMVWMSTFVLFATKELGLSSWGFGVIAVVASLGGLAGSLVAPKLTGLPTRWTLFCSVLCSGVALAVLSVTRTPWLAGLLLAVGNAGVLVWNVLTVAKRQRMIPAELMGRVSAGYRFFVQLAMPIGAFIGGWAAKEWGLPSTFLISGCLTLFAAFAIPLALRGESSDSAVADEQD